MWMSTENLVVLGLTLLWLSLLLKSIHRVIVNAALNLETKTLRTGTQGIGKPGAEFHRRIEYQL